MVGDLCGGWVVSWVAPVGAGDPDPRDLDAVEALQRNEDARLELVRARAEKWIAGVGGLSGVLATGLVIKGPDDATRVVLGWRIVAAGLIGLAVGLLAYATFRAYRAAFGEPDALREMSAVPVDGAAARLSRARREAADAALGDLATAIRGALSAVALIVMAVAITWFASPAADSTVCLFAQGKLHARVDGSIVAVRALSAGITLEPCR